MKKRAEGFGIQFLTTQWREDKLERLCNCQVSVMCLIFMDPRLKYTTLSISLPAMCRTASLNSSPAAIFSRYIVTMTFKILVAVTLQFSSHKSPGALKHLGKNIFRHMQMDNEFHQLLINGQHSWSTDSSFLLRDVLQGLHQQSHGAGFCSGPYLYSPRRLF